MRILALDISTNPGFAVVDIKPLKRGPTLALAHVSSLKTDTSTPDYQRYTYIEAHTLKILHEYGPFDAVVKEHFTKGRSKRSTQTVFGAWAAIDIALGRYGYSTDAEITPSAVKKAVTGDGAAKKPKVEAHVRKWFALDDDFVFKTDDESDAMAIALTYAIQNGLIKEARK